MEGMRSGGVVGWMCVGVNGRTNGGERSERHDGIE